MSTVWSASMSNSVSDLACHMCLSAYELPGRVLRRQLDEQQLQLTDTRCSRLQYLLLLSDIQQPAINIMELSKADVSM